jgi:hypothetical protein
MPKDPSTQKEAREIELRIEKVSSGLQDISRISQYSIVEGPGRMVNSHGVADAYQWIINTEKTLNHIDEELRPTRVEADSRYRALRTHYREKEAGVYLLGKIGLHLSGTTTTRQTITDVLYPILTPGIVNSVLADMVASRNNARSTNIVAAFMKEDQDSRGYFTKPPVMALRLK